MDRGYDGNEIFARNKNKAQFLEFLEGTAKKMKIHLLAYCIKEIAREKHNRRKRPAEQSDGVNRQDERCFEPVKKVLQEFGEMKAVPISGIDTGTYKGKRQRGELLVLLCEFGVRGRCL